MTTLVLGHGRLYADGEIENPESQCIRCSPIDKCSWLNVFHTSVDIDPEVLPDIVYDLFILPWRFAANGQFDRIVDTCGMAIERLYKNDRFIAELDRVLITGGMFFGRRGFVHTKSKAKNKT